MITHAGLLAVLLVTSHMAQKPHGPRAFAYEPAKAGAGFFVGEAVPEEQKATKPEEANSQATAAKKPLLMTSVSVSGNFSGVFDVNGMGTGTSLTSSNAVQVQTNRALTFWANSFKPLMAAGSSEAGMGSIMYSMALYQGTPSHVGVLVSGPVSGVDGAFNGKALILNSAQIPSGGNLVLVLTRTLTLNQTAVGAYKLVGTGNIGVTIN